MPDEGHAGPGSALAKLRWQLAQQGFDGAVADGGAGPAVGSRDKNVVEMVAQVGEATPAALIYLVSVTAISGMAKVAGEWVRNQNKRITITAKRRDGGTIEIDANNPPADLSQLIGELNGTGDSRHDDASDG
ncbi:hypothetical protein DMB66_29260 [Actinoplanes sp. ATCC 53533]|nr:hypothetical protein DMB66_29260 [Actinoplanes sp. ATCC 53533]